jgi:hypothetical protein
MMLIFFSVLIVVLTHDLSILLTEVCTFVSRAKLTKKWTRRFQ